jgi:Transposase DDE domain
VAFLKQSIASARSIVQKVCGGADLLVRLDAGHDDIENVELCRKTEGVDFIIKRNLRRENVEEWLTIAQAHGVCEQPREGKTVWRGDHWVQRRRKGPSEAGHPYRVVFEVTERTIDKHGQQLLVPDIEINTWWTSLPPTKVTAEDVIELYHQHGTSEQFHSEFKSDLDLERLPSGKFNTNALILSLGMLAYNALRLIGQCALDEDKKLPPDQKPPLKRVAKRGHKPRMKRRRLRRVIQDLMYLSAKLVCTGRRWCLRLSRRNPWSAVCRALYLRLTPV